MSGGPDAKAIEAALRAEAERLRRLVSELARANADAAGIDDAETLAEIQDRNLAAFEKMIADVGQTALEAVRDALPAAEAAVERGDGAAAMTQLTAVAALNARERDTQTAALMAEILANFRAAARAHPEPFE